MITGQLLSKVHPPIHPSTPMPSPHPSSLTLNDGTTVPWLAFGTGTALYSKDVSNIVRAALVHGFTHIDTAQVYQNERSVGEALRAAGIPRENVYVTTKLGKIDTAKGESVESALRESLDKLGVEYVDLFLVHAPLNHVGQLKQVWKDVVDVKRKGLTKSIGVSNFTVKQLKEIIEDGDEVPAVNQVSIYIHICCSTIRNRHISLSTSTQIEYHPWLLTATRSLLQFHAQHKIITASYGGLTPILPRRGAGEASLADSRARLVTVLDKLASARGENVTQNQILLKWLQHNGILAVT